MKAFNIGDILRNKLTGNKVEVISINSDGQPMVRDIGGKVTWQSINSPWILDDSGVAEDKDVDTIEEICFDRRKPSRDYSHAFDILKSMFREGG